MILTKFEGNRIAIFESIKSKHCVLTNDLGCVKEGFNGGSPQLTGFLDRFYGPGHSLFPLRVKHGHRVETTAWNINNANRQFEADGLMYDYNRFPLPGKNLADRLLPSIIGSTTGDCPHLVYEAAYGNLGLVGTTHISWMNAGHDMPGRTMIRVQQMGYPLDTLRIALWTGICVNCNEVDKPVQDALIFYPQHLHPGKDKDHWQLDLAGIILEQLERAGIRPGQIETSYVCPCCYRDEDDQPLFFSYRRHYFEPQKEMRRNGLFIRA